MPHFPVWGNILCVFLLDLRQQEAQESCQKVEFIFKMVLTAEDSPAPSGRDKSLVNKNSPDPPGRQGQVDLAMDFASLPEG